VGQCWPIALQQLALRLEQGRAGELVPRLEARVADRADHGPARISLAQALAGAGELSGARTELQRVAADDLGTVPRDSTWSGSLARMAEVCSAVGDAGVAEQLHRELEPYAGQLVVVSWGVVCLGAADSHLRMLEATVGRFDDASLRYAAALQLEERAGAALPAAWTRARWAHALRTSGGAGELRQAETLVADARRAARSLQLPARSAAVDGVAPPTQQPVPSGADDSFGERRP
jgi:hypothetical protein